MSSYNSAAIEEFKGGVWVFCEQRQGTMMSTSFELISEGRKLADELGSKLYGVLLGDNVEGLAKELGGSIKLKAAVRFEKGEGIEKKQENFAEEIAKQLAK